MIVARLRADGSEGTRDDRHRPMRSHRERFGSRPAVGGSVDGPRGGWRGGVLGRDGLLSQISNPSVVPVHACHPAVSAVLEALTAELADEGWHHHLPPPRQPPGREALSSSNDSEHCVSPVLPGDRAGVAQVSCSRSPLARTRVGPSTGRSTRRASSTTRRRLGPWPRSGCSPGKTSPSGYWPRSARA